MSDQITANFSVPEFTCHDGTPYPIDNVEDGAGVPTGWHQTEAVAGKPWTWRDSRLAPLGLTLQAFRDYAQKKYNLSDVQARMTVDSGYRDEAYDQRIYEKHVAAYGDDGLVAPASVSIHPKGGAADMVHAGLRPGQVFVLALAMFEDGLLPYLGGIGLYPNFVHFDVRPRTRSGAHLAIWGGARPSNIA